MFLDLLRQLLSSKKFVVTLTAVLVWVLARVGWDVPESTLLPVIGALVAFVLAQGWADRGKEAVKEAAALGELGLMDEDPS